MMLRKIRWVPLSLLISFLVIAPCVFAQKKSIEQRVDSVMK
jgi:hypothetical protein